MMRLFPVVIAGLVITVGTIVVPIPAVNSKSAVEIGKIAKRVTVQVQKISPRGSAGGSGVVIAKDGNEYTLLTAFHVVDDTSANYQVRTFNNRVYRATRVVRFNSTPGSPDLAIVSFRANEAYDIAAIGNSDGDLAQEGADIFVAGFPKRSGGVPLTDWQFEFSKGAVTSRPPSAANGYSLRYNAVTRGGMSGGPVFDTEGSVVGMHGTGDLDDNPNPTADGPVIKTGFNAAIPIAIFMAVKPANVLVTRANTGTTVATLPTPTPTTTPTPIAVLPTPAPTPTIASSIPTPLPTRTPVIATLPSPRSTLLPTRTPSPATTSSPARQEYKRGLTLFERSDFNAALAAFDRAIALKPNYAIAHFQRGNTLYELARATDAIGAYDRAIQYDPRNIRAYLNRAKVKRDLGDAIGSTRDYTQALRVLNAPSNPVEED
jgi:serine protease Do